MQAAILLAFVALGQDASARTHDIQPDDYFTQAFPNAVVASPDGSAVVYTEMRWEKENDKRNTDLWSAEVESGRVTRLTFDPATDANPKWSPDGRWVYFTSARKRGDGEPAPYNGKTQVWRVSPEGGEIFPVTRLEKGIKQFDLAGDGETLYYTAGRDAVDQSPWKSLKDEHDGVTYGHGVVEYSQLWALDLQTWRAQQLVDDSRVIVAFTVSPDERRVAMITAPTAELITNEGWSRVDVYDVASGQVTLVPDRLWREDAPSPYGWIVSPTWSSSGDTLAFRVDFDGYPGQIFVARFDAAGNPRASEVTRPGEVSAEGDMRWVPGTDDLCFLGEDRARARVYRVHGVAMGRQTGSSIMTPGDVVVSTFGFSRDGRKLAVIMNDATSTPEVYVAPVGVGGEALRRVTRLNPQVDTWKLPSIEVVRWTSDDGTEVEGILELPPGWKPEDGPLPMVVQIHGGPTASTKLNFQFWIYGRGLFAARGWALFSPNYRGSTGYGDEFLTDLIGHKNDRDVRDIMTGIDALVERGIADPERLGVMGWSNGGYLTNCLITQSDRFKAASSGAGVLDTVMQWEIEDTPGHVVNYSQGLPWTNRDRMLKASPLYDLDRVVTPTVVHVGEKDERVPAEHSRALHRSLHHYLHVPCELVVYPGAAHGLTKYSHRKAKLDWDVAWFDYHVLGRAPE